MIKENLQKYTILTGYNLAQVEIDYLQHICLQILYSKYDTLYFKGGTCLQKCYGLNRFSEDLDFNYENMNPQDALLYLQKNFPYDLEVKKIHEHVFGVSARISIKGLLYDGNERSKCKITFDFRENDTYKKVDRIVIGSLYTDIVEYTILSLSKIEIVAEKIRAIMTRNKGRDVFDLYHLLKQEITVDKDLVNRKLQTYSLTFAYNIFEEKLQQKEKIYNIEIQSLVKSFPSFEECVTYICSVMHKIR